MARHLTRLVTLALAAGLLASCVLPEQSEQPGDPNPPQQGDPPAFDTSGTYQLVTHIDFTADAALPQPAYDAVQVLAQLRDDPAELLFSLLDEAGVPLVAELMDALPGALQDQLKGWINDYIAGALYQDQPVVDAIDALLAQSKTVLTRFDLVSELDLAASPATHTLRALRMRVDGHELEVAIEVPEPADAALMLEALVPVSITAAQDDAALDLDHHAFGLPYGDHAYSALEYLIRQRYDMDPRQTLGALIDCPALAASVASRCVAGVCVGHEQELQSICEQGLDLAVAELQARMQEQRFDALELVSGEALMIDTGARITGGAWQTRIDVGQGPRPVPATFTGTRQ